MRPFVVLVACLAVCGGLRADKPNALPAVSRCERAVIAADVEVLRNLRQSQLALVQKDRGVEPQSRYDLAFFNWRLNQLLPRRDKKERHRLLKEAEAQLDLLLAAEPGNAEAHALRGSVIGERISGMISGMRLGKKSSTALDRGFELAPDNPRVALQRGIGWFYTPKSFGGGVDKAETELLRAGKLFAGEPAAKAWPNWGRVDVSLWLGQVAAKRGDKKAAERFYREALALEPAHAWILDELLPAVMVTNSRE